MNEVEILEQIEQLKVEYKDVKSVLETLSKDLNNTAHLRGALSGAGAAAELILKCVYRRERKVDDKIPSERANEIKKQESEKLMLDELIRNVESNLPLRITTHLRTIQAWRNIGSHNKGHVSETINEATLQVVLLALNELVTWFIGEYLNHDLELFTSIKGSSNNENQTKSAELEIQTSINGEITQHSEKKLWKIWEKSESGNRYGFINNEGTIIVYPLYEQVDFLDDSRETVCVKINNKWGLIDSDGKWIIQPKFDWSFKFNEGVSSVCLNSKYGIIDNSDNWIAQPIFDQLGDFYDGLTYAFLNGKCGFINKSGNWIIQPMFDNVEVKLFQEGLAGVQFKDKWGYIDKSGNWIIQPMFDEIEGFSEGLAFVELDEKWGVIDKNGLLVIEPIYEKESYFKNGCAVVKYNGLYGIIDKLGDWVKSPFSGLIIHDNSFINAYNGPSKYGIGEKCGILDLNGNWVIEPIYAILSSCKNDLFVARIDLWDDKTGFIDFNGNWVIQPIFDLAESFDNGLALVSVNSKYGYINTKGNWVFQPTLEEEEEEEEEEDGEILDLDLNESSDEIFESNDSNTFEEFYADDFNLNSYFLNISSKLKITDQIDSKKIDSLLSNIDGEDYRDTYNECEFWVFYDSTFWQSGKEGFLICSDANYIYFIYNISGSGIFTFAIDDVNDTELTYISGLELLNNKVVITYDEDDEYHIENLPQEISTALNQFYLNEIEPRKCYE
jgi:hypothetical protein